MFKPHMLDLQAWAVASGKINDFPNDKARWKTNFRCALNNLSERFKMVQDNSKTSDDPHKIYEIINTSCKGVPNPHLPCAVYTLNATLFCLQTTTKTCRHSPPGRMLTWLQISTTLLWSTSHFHLRCSINLPYHIFLFLKTSGI